MEHEALDAVVEQVLASRKYRAVCPLLVRRIAAREVHQQRTLRNAVKATKNKLHQVGGAYLNAHLDYTKYRAALRHTVDDDVAFQQTCRQIMARHASTRERLALLPHFYQTLLADSGPVTTILDLACGFNPLTLPWLWGSGAAARPVRYYAYDIYADLANFLNDYFDILGIGGGAYVHDLMAGAPTQTADVAFLFKTLPVLEQVETGAASRLLDTIDARVLLISYPAASLGGRAKGMLFNYEEQFRALMTERSGSVEKFVFETELVFRVTQ